MNEPIKINWYRSKVDRAVMSRLVQRKDARAFAQVFLQLGLFVVTGGSAYALYQQIDGSNWPWMVPLLLLALFVHGTNGSFFGGVACHELCHKTPFTSPFWNTSSSASTRSSRGLIPWPTARVTSGTIRRRRTRSMTARSCCRCASIGTVCPSSSRT